jgi:hypothetical protein
MRIPSPAVSNRMFESTGSVVFEGMLAETAARPWCRFWRVIEKFMGTPAEGGFEEALHGKGFLLLFFYSEQQ